MISLGNETILKGNKTILLGRKTILKGRKIVLSGVKTTPKWFFKPFFAEFEPKRATG